jgi:ATP-dependent DNA helicase RecG
VLKEAADAAGAVLAKDELLSSEENVYLKTKVEEYTKECLENINL